MISFCRNMRSLFRVPFFSSVNSLSSSGTSILGAPTANNGILGQKSQYSQICGQSTGSRILLSAPIPALTTQVAGFKVKYALRKRCKDCHILVSNERMFIMCPTHPRHKQMAPVKKPRYKWILTHATQSKVRPW